MYRWSSLVHYDYSPLPQQKFPTDGKVFDSHLTALFSIPVLTAANLISLDVKSSHISKIPPSPSFIFCVFWIFRSSFSYHPLNFILLIPSFFTAFYPTLHSLSTLFHTIFTQPLLPHFSHPFLIIFLPHPFHSSPLTPSFFTTPFPYHPFHSTLFSSPVSPHPFQAAQFTSLFSNHPFYTILFTPPFHTAFFTLSFSSHPFHTTLVTFTLFHTTIFTLPSSSCPFHTTLLTQSFSSHSFHTILFIPPFPHHPHYHTIFMPQIFTLPFFTQFFSFHPFPTILFTPTFSHHPFPRKSLHYFHSILVWVCDCNALLLLKQFFFFFTINNTENNGHRKVLICLSVWCYCPPGAKCLAQCWTLVLYSLTWRQKACWIYVSQAHR